MAEIKLELELKQHRLEHSTVQLEKQSTKSKQKIFRRRIFKVRKEVDVQEELTIKVSKT